MSNGGRLLSRSGRSISTDLLAARIGPADAPVLGRSADITGNSDCPFEQLAVLEHRRNAAVGPLGHGVGKVLAARDVVVGSFVQPRVADDRIGGVAVEWPRMPDRVERRAEAGGGAVQVSQQAAGLPDAFVALGMRMERRRRVCRSPPRVRLGRMDSGQVADQCVAVPARQSMRAVRRVISSRSRVVVVAERHCGGGWIWSGASRNGRMRRMISRRQAANLTDVTRIGLAVAAVAAGVAVGASSPCSS
jgi:hypothetical protein